MKDLLSLIEIIRNKGQRRLRLVDHNFRKEDISKDNLLYEGIESGKFRDEIDASYQLFGESPAHRNYRNTRNRLKENLLNHLFFLNYDSDKHTAFTKARYEGARVAFQCEILIIEDLHEMAYAHAKKVLEETKEFELYELSLKFLMIMSQAAAEHGNAKEYNELIKKIDQTRELQNAWSEAFRTFNKAIFEINRSQKSRLKELERMENTTKTIKRIASKYQSTRINILSFDLELIANQLKGFYQKNVELCTYLEKKYLNRPRNLIRVELNPERIAFIKMYSYYVLGESSKGFSYFNKAQETFEVNSQSWLGFTEYGLRICLKDAMFDKAVDCFREVKDSRIFHQQEVLEKERWYLYTLYLHLYSDGNFKIRNFNEDEFLSATPVYPEVKDGYNLNFLLAQLMMLVKYGATESLEMKVVELNNFFSNRGRNSRTRRSKLFIKMVNAVIKEEYSYAQVYVKTEKNFKKLQAVKSSNDFYNFMEIVKYEWLWEDILRELQTNKNYKHYRFYHKN
jgi:hypothetical protein